MSEEERNRRAGGVFPGNCERRVRARGNEAREEDEEAKSRPGAAADVIALPRSFTRVRGNQENNEWGRGEARARESGGDLRRESFFPPPRQPSSAFCVSLANPLFLYSRVHRRNHPPPRGSVFSGSLDFMYFFYLLLYDSPSSSTMGTGSHLLPLFLWHYGTLPSGTLESPRINY